MTFQRIKAHIKWIPDMSEHRLISAVYLKSENTARIYYAFI